jgi:hypothetical protein
MPDFSDPKYASYIQFCRELGLAHEFREGDWWIWHGDREVPNCHCDPSTFVGPRTTQLQPNYARIYWLPTLADWLEMLEAKGYDYVQFWPRANPRSWECEAQGINAPRVTTAYSGGSVFDTREEAAARLWKSLRMPDAGAP